MFAIRRLTACTTLVALLSLGASASAFAQSAEACPSLPNDAGMTWKQLDGPGFVFCKAIRDSDQQELFAVTISGKSPFKPIRSNREERAVIDSHEAYWYRSEIASSPDAEVRETLIELNDDQVAHINFRANGPDQLAERLQQVQAIRFEGTRLTSK